MAEPPGPVDLQALMTGLVDILANGNALAMQFERLARDLGVPPGAPTIVFLTGVKRILRELPDRAYPEKNARIALTSAVQDALDDAIDAEETLEGEESADAAP